MKRRERDAGLPGEILRGGLRLAVCLLGLCGLLAGCGDGVRAPVPEQLADFEQAGPGGPTMDLTRLSQARLQTGPYRLVPGDVVQLEMPAHLFPDVLGTQTAVNGKLTQNCRLNSSGMITLPDGRQLSVKGQSLAEVEATVADTYYPSLVKTRPAVYAQVIEYATANIRIMGAVARPGLYRVRHDQMSVVGVLMEAGEIVEGGAATIRIVRPAAVADENRVPPRGESSGTAGVRSRTNRPYEDRSLTGLVVRFKPEGQLRTTGWLTIENSGGVLANQWLDIGVRGQRQAVLRAAGAKAGSLPVDQLEARLSRLAQLADSRPLGEEGDVPAAAPGVFAAAVDGADSDPTRRTPPGGVLKKLVYESSEAGRATTGNEMMLTLPVRGLNIPFADVPLVDGDSIIVERIRPQTISVMGLVARPGSFPYPPNVHYTLAEALALAGGLDMVAEPHFVSVYRLRGDGTVASATFQFTRNSGPEHLTEALALKVKPGDVISVEHTLRTRTNVFFDRIVRITLGWYFQPDDLWN